ncbi:MAG TPA: hypothetical protein PKB15_01210 [Acidimicrobiia bacterium]|nr:hypothetical protein [Acidimicrobiia bacterium]
MDEQPSETLRAIQSAKKQIRLSRFINKTFLHTWVVLIFALTSIGLIAVSQSSSQAASTFTQPSPRGEIGATDTTGIYCGGTGTDGSRFQAIYAYTTDRVNRNAAITSQYIIPTINDVDRLLRASAEQTGGFRQARWVTDASCNLNVRTIAVGFSTQQWALMNASERVNALLALGGEPNRKYAIWLDLASADSNWTAAVGNIAFSANTIWWTPGAQNGIAHEMMHTLGAVSAGAPHRTNHGHCTDGLDIMCYDDDQPGEPDGPGSQRNVCSIALYDCNHDDYFYAGTPPQGNYLASNPSANTANSPFLATAPSGPPTTTTTTTTRPPGPVRPANDNFASATVIPYAPTSQLNGTNVNATSETGEPSHAGNRAVKSIWYSWTPTVSGTFQVKTHTDGGPTSNFNTVLAVYKRGPTTQFNGLVLISSNDDFNGRIQSKVLFNAEAGKRYWIAIDGKNGASGTTVLQIKKL